MIKFNDFTKISEAIYKNSFKLNVFSLECDHSNKNMYTIAFQKHLSRQVLNLGDDVILNLGFKNVIDKYLIEV